MTTSLQRAGAQTRIITAPDGLDGADALLLPGVGAFGPAMANLAEQGLLDPVLEWARADRPFLAVCVGMQLLFERSEEDGEHPGLALVRGTVTRLPAGLKVPEMGWNTIRVSEAARSSDYGPALADGGYYYYAHSYAALSDERESVLATSTYGVEYVSVVGRGRMLGTQFHPEKSSRVGLAILERFVAVARGGA
jgi:imidazole glycerol phosphate synthase glutamine amidotransferase subunit